MREIFDKLNTQNSLNDILCLADVKSYAEKCRAQEAGYAIGYTKQEWETEYPNIPAEKVFARKTSLFPPSLMYYDKSKGICFELGIYNTAFLSQSGDKAAYEKKILNTIEKWEQDYKEHRYSSMLCRSATEGSGRITMQLLTDLLKTEEPSEDLYCAFLSSYSFVDCGVEILSKNFDTMNLLLKCKSDKQKKETEDRMRHLPDVITIYRGEGSKSTSTRHAISWTTDIRKAYFFACWRGPEKAKIVTATVAKKDVVEYITDRGESEIIAFPDDVHRTGSFRLYSVHDFAAMVNFSAIE